MTEFLDVAGGRIAYDVTGSGPLVVLSHGMGDTRTAFRFLAPKLVDAGYRVATADLRGMGESSTGFAAYTRTETAGDLLALIRHLGGGRTLAGAGSAGVAGRAVIVGHSYSGGAATIAAALEPESVSGIVELDSFTRAQKIDFGGLIRNARYRKGMRLLMSVGMFGSLKLMVEYLDHAYPGVKPVDWDQQLDAARANLGQPARMKVLQAMGRSAPTDAGALLSQVRCPALITAGTLDPDWNDPKSEVDGIVAAMPAGIATAAMFTGAGHYPHVQYPDKVAEVLLPFLKKHAA